MLSVGRYGVARLQMKFGHMDGMHCIIDGTSILVKIKSVALYNSQTVYSFQPFCGLGVDSASNRNEYQEYFLGGTGGWCIGMKALPPSCADCLKVC